MFGHFWRASTFFFFFRMELEVLAVRTAPQKLTALNYDNEKQKSDLNVEK